MTDENIGQKDLAEVKAKIGDLQDNQKTKQIAAAYNKARENFYKMLQQKTQTSNQKLQTQFYKTLEDYLSTEENKDKVGEIIKHLDFSLNEGIVEPSLLGIKIPQKSSFVKQPLKQCRSQVQYFIKQLTSSSNLSYLKNIGTDMRNAFNAIDQNQPLPSLNNSNVNDENFHITNKEILEEEQKLQYYNIIAKSELNQYINKALWMIAEIIPHNMALNIDNVANTVVNEEFSKSIGTETITKGGFQIQDNEINKPSKVLQRKLKNLNIKNDNGSISFKINEKSGIQGKIDAILNINDNDSEEKEPINLSIKNYNFATNYNISLQKITLLDAINDSKYKNGLASLLSLPWENKLKKDYWEKGALQGLKLAMAYSALTGRGQRHFGNAAYADYILIEKKARSSNKDLPTVAVFSMKSLLTDDNAENHFSYTPESAYEKPLLTKNISKYRIKLNLQQKLLIAFAEAQKRKIQVGLSKSYIEEKQKEIINS